MQTINRKNRNSKTATPVCLIDSQKTLKEGEESNSDKTGIQK